MSIYLHSPYVAVLHRKMTELQPYIHHGLHLQCSVTVARKSSEHGHGEMVREENFKHFQSSLVLDILPLCHKFAFEPQTVDEGHGHFTEHP